MPTSSAPNHLGTDPSLLDPIAILHPASDFDDPLISSPSAASHNSPAPPPPEESPDRKPGDARVHRLGTEQNDRFLDTVAKDYPGFGSYSVGYTMGQLANATHLDKDIAIAYTDASGTRIAWEQQYGGRGDDVANAVAIEPYSSDLFITGYSEGDFAGTGSGGKDVWFGRFSPGGNIMNPFLFKWGSAGDDVAEAIATDNHYNIYLAGYTTGDLVGNNDGGKDAWVAKFSQEGELQWTYKVGTLGDDVATGIAVGDLGEVFVTGYSTHGWSENNLGNGSSSAWVFKLDMDGIREWQDYIVGGDTKAYDIAVRNSGDIYVTGSTTGDLEGTNAGGIDAWVARYDRDFYDLYRQKDPNWIEQLGTAGDDIAYSIAIDGAERIYLAGSTTGAMAGRAVGGQDAWFAAYDTHSNPMQPELRWKQQLGTTGDDIATGIDVGHNGDTYFLAGYTNGQLGNYEHYGFDPIGGFQNEDMWTATYSQFNQIPEGLTFSLDRTSYWQQDTLEIYGEVGERDTIYDISHIEMSLIKGDGTEISLPEITAITARDWETIWGDFNYRLNLNRYGLEQGDYTLRGTARDRAGHDTGATFEQVFSITSPLMNQAPEGLEAHLKDSWQTFTPGQTLEVEYGRVFDYDGASNLTHIAFELIDPNGAIVQLPEATQIYTETGNSYDPYARFDYSFQLPTDLQLSGQYILKAVAYDGSGATSLPFENSINIEIDHHFSYGPHFNLDRYDYQAYETIQLENVHIHHPDGIDKIESVQFFLRDLNKNTELALGKVTQWTNFGSSDAEFHYNINLGALGLEEGSYELFARAYDTSGRTSDHPNQQNFYVRSNPNHYFPLNFQLAKDRAEYKNTETISIRDSHIHYPDGIENIARVDFRLQKMNGYYGFIDLPDVTEFNLQGSSDATFEYSVNLSPYDLEINQSYSLWVTAYDALGYSSVPISHSFYLRDNQAPMGISFNLNSSYLSTEIIEIDDGIIHDPNGSADIDRIAFQLRHSDGTILALTDATNFIPNDTAYEEARFTHNINLGNYNLDPGSYTLIATGYDLDGAMGHEFETAFEILSPNASPESLRFGLDRSDYKPTDTVRIKEGWVKDPDGAQDIVNIRYDLRREDGTVVANDAIGDLTAASWDPLWVSFAADIHLSAFNLADGTYTIAAIAYDIANTASNLFERSFTITTPPPNVNPSNLTFNLDASTYKPTDTINLLNGWVKDGNGAETLDRIDLSLVNEQGTAIDIADIATLNPASWNPQWASFQHGLTLEGLNLQGGTYRLVGVAYDEAGTASGQFERSFSLEVPQPNLNPTDLRFSLNKSTYNPTDTLTIRNGWVQDGDGWEDLESVSFKIVASNGSEIDLGGLNNFVNVGWTQKWASFSGGFDLSQYNLGDGTYTLVGVAIDQSGGESQTLSRNFTIKAPQSTNTAPARLQFGLSGSTFSVNDTVQITNGWVYDQDGNSDLVGVDFELVAENGTVIDVGDSLNFTTVWWDRSRRWNSFRHGINLSEWGLSTGRYTLRGKAYDQAGDYSNSFSRSFTLV
ncbi:MAG: SBBP repeat-containing protein [Spirulina sp.]